MLESIDKLDKTITVFLNGLHADWLDRVFYLISDPKISIPWFIFLFYLIYKKHNLKTLVLSMAGIGLVILLCDRISVELFKNVFERLRPSHSDDPIVKGVIHNIRDWNGNLYRGGKYGFVSSHATNYFGMGMFFYLAIRPISRKMWWLIFGWVIIVGYSRIYLGVHYLGDILGGALLGVVLGSFAYGLYSIAENKMNKRSKPISNPDILDVN